MERDHKGFGLYQNGDDSHNKVKPIKVKVAVGHCDITMDVDTGVSRSMISENVYRNNLYKYPLIDTNITIHSYMGQLVPTLVCVKVPVKYPGNPEMLFELVVVKGACLCLLGRDWLSKIKLDWENIFSVSEISKTKVPESKDYPPEFNRLLDQNIYPPEFNRLLDQKNNYSPLPVQG